MPNEHKKTFEGFGRLNGFEDLTNDEKSFIEKEFFDMLTIYSNSNHRNRTEIIKATFLFALLAHRGVRRRSGEPYILHPIAVARIVAQDIGLGSTSICAALLHDVVEDTEYTADDLSRNFSPKIAQLVEGVTKISGGVFGEQASVQAENFRKLLLTMSDDIRVVLIKLADRLHNMRTLGSMPIAKQFKIAGETEYIYAPLANRLGLHKIKTELENLSFLYDRPEQYKELEEKISGRKIDIDQFYTDFTNPIQEKLDANGYDFTIQKRIKTVYSIWQKMKNKNIPFEDIRDILAVRIIFSPKPDIDEKVQCWMIYSVITSIYKPHPERIKDWVSNPKANGYEALHVTVMKPGGDWVEIQIRSDRMHDIAERGLAAHWKYKNNDQTDKELDKWIGTIRELLKTPESSAVDLMENIKLNLYSAEIFIFTPKGETRIIGKGSTVLDFAFSLHSDIGYQSIAAKVNYGLVPLNHVLESGDRVEILTSKKSEPKREWLNFVTTGSARSKIKSYFKRQDKELILKGTEVIEEVFHKKGLDLNDKNIHKILNHYKLDNWNSYLLEIGKTTISEDDIPKILTSNTNQQTGNRVMKILNTLNPFVSQKQTTENNIEEGKNVKFDFKRTQQLIGANLNITYSLATCCNPIPGDLILGYVDNQNMIQLHKRDCNVANSIKSNYGGRIISVEWTETQDLTFPERLEVQGIDERGILMKVLNIVSEKHGINISKMEIEKKNELFIGVFDILVHNTNEMQNMIKQISNISQISSVKRLVKK